MSSSERRLAERLVTGFVGLIDAAEILGWRRQTLWTELNRQELRREESPDVTIEGELPTAIGRVRATRLFLRSEYEAYALANPDRCPNAPSLKKVS